MTEELQNAILESLSHIDATIIQSTLSNKKNIHLAQSISCLLNDPYYQFDSERIYKELVNYKTLNKNQLLLLHAKSNLLRHSLNVSEFNPIIQPIVLIIQYFETKSLLQFQPKNSTGTPKKTYRSISPKQPSQNNSSITFINKPKYFHTQCQSSEQIQNQIVNKQKELKKYLKLQEELDEYQRYNQWHLQQQQLKEEQKQQIILERKKSREFRTEQFRSTSPRISVSKTIKQPQSDYIVQIQKLTQEIKQLEQQIS